MSSMAFCPGCHTPSAPAVSADYEGCTCNETIGGPYNAIHCALPCSVSVIKEVLGIGIVYRNDRELEDSVILHAP